jgi:PAS domain-containing protein
MIDFNIEKPQSNENSEGLDYVNPGLPHVTFVVDFLPSGEFRFVRVNSLYESVMGLAPEMIQGKTLSQLFPEAIAQRMAANFTRSWQLNQSISYEEFWPAAGEEDCWIVTLFPLSNEASSGDNNRGDSDEVVSGDRADNFPVNTPVNMGENCPVNRLIGVSVNLTDLQKNQGLSIFCPLGDRQKAENQLLRTQTRFETALKNSAIAVFQQDRQLRYTWAYNPHDIEAEAILGKTDLELLPPEDALYLMQIKQRVLDTGIGCREEVEITIAGQVNFYDLTVEPLYDSNQNSIGVKIRHNL